MTDAPRSFICGPGFCIGRKETPADRVATAAFEDWLQAYRKEHGEFPREKEQIKKLIELMKQAGRFNVVKGRDE